MANSSTLTGSGKLEQHLYEMCENMDSNVFRELAGSSEHWDVNLLSRILEYHHGDRSRRPLGKDKILELRNEILNNLDDREKAMENYPTISLGEILTDAQLDKAKEIIEEDGPRTRDLLMREVLTMEPPEGVIVKKDEHARIEQYGPFHPPYLAYVIIYAVNNAE